MKVTILQVDAIPNKKTQEINHSMTVLGTFSSYGQVRPATAQVKLTRDEYKKYQELQGKEVTLEVVMPLPEFPLQLA